MESQQSKLIIYDPLYQKIIIQEKVIEELIDSPEFQRLKQIKQLGTLSQWINSASHSRYSHSLGVYHLIATLFQRKQFHHLPLHQKLEVMVAGLLHDIGHGPYSHIFEKVAKNFKHEELSVILINNQKGTIYPILKKYHLNRERINKLILNQNEQDWGQALISGQFDLDRLDFLIRDRYFLGYNSEININHLMDNIIWRPDKLLFQEEAILDLENYLLSRYYIHKNFFWHPENLFFDNLFIKIFQRLQDLAKKGHNFLFSLGALKAVIEQKELPLKSFLKLNDPYLWNFFQVLLEKSKDLILVDLINKFFSFSHRASYQIDYANKKRGKPYYFHHNQLQLTLYDTKKKEIMILDRKGKIQKLSQVSMIFNESKKYQTSYTIHY